jgi:hypothetical protein
MPGRFQGSPLLAEVEEQLPLVLRGPDLDQPPVVEDVLEDVGADPPPGVGAELHPAVGIELLHRLDQADVPLLHQVEQVLVGAAILVGDLHHQAQVRGHQLAWRPPRRRARPSAPRARAPPPGSTASDAEPRPCRRPSDPAGPAPSCPRVPPWCDRCPWRWRRARRPKPDRLRPGRFGRGLILRLGLVVVFGDALDHFDVDRLLRHRLRALLRLGFGHRGHAESTPAPGLGATPQKLAGKSMGLTKPMVRSGSPGGC